MKSSIPQFGRDAQTAEKAAYEREKRRRGIFVILAMFVFGVFLFLLMNIEGFGLGNFFMASGGLVFALAVSFQTTKRRYKQAFFERMRSHGLSETQAYQEWRNRHSSGFYAGE